MNKKEINVNRILAKIKGIEFCYSIPVSYWITNPAEVGRRLNAAGKRLGFNKRFEPGDVGRKGKI